jgi:glycine/D-amino acid oxidase-like deaminating enzyme
MKTYDWVVVGAGITGAAVSYELVQQGFNVLLLEKTTISKALPVIATADWLIGQEPQNSAVYFVRKDALSIKAYLRN